MTANPATRTTNQLGINYVYKITNLINNKIYIGVSYNPEYRFMRHKVEKDTVGKAIAKYGKENFKLEILDSGTAEYCYKQEIYFIKLFKSNQRGIGYNMTEGGENPPTTRGKAHYNYGKKISESTKNKIRAARKKQVISPEDYFKATIQRLGEGNPLAVLTEEKVLQIRELYSTGLYSYPQLAEMFNTKKSTVFNVVIGRTWRHVGGDIKFVNAKQYDDYVDYRKQLYYNPNA